MEHIFKGINPHCLAHRAFHLDKVFLLLNLLKHIYHFSYSAMLIPFGFLVEEVNSVIESLNVILMHPPEVSILHLISEESGMNIF